MEVFVEIAATIFVTLLLSGIAKVLKQPLIIAYIFAGVIAGPYFMNILSSFESFNVFSQIGIAFLLFIVGLGLNPSVIKSVGKISLVTGVGQVLFTSIIGVFIGLGLGFDFVSSIYIAVALTFSSTIIIVKLISDKNELDSLYGKIAVGFLIVQDLIAMLILVTLSSTAGGADLFSTLLYSAVKGFLLIGILFFVSKFLFHKLLDFVAKSQELLLLFALGWCFFLAAVFQLAGFSIEMGALLAGVTISFSSYRFEISFKVRILRDFFLVLFFIYLGTQLGFGSSVALLLPIIIFSIFILVGNPFIVIILMGLLGYTKRTSFLAGLTVAQISEFSIILVTLGIKLGHLSKEILFLITAVGIITIAGSTYMITYSEKIYPLLAPFLSFFERKSIHRNEKTCTIENPFECVLFGYNRIGFDVVKSLKKIGVDFMVVDYNPDTIRDLEAKKIPCKYGDSSDAELLEEICVSKTKMIISTVPDAETNLLLINHAKRLNKDIIVIVVSSRIDEALELYKAGATYVIIPHFLGGHFTSTLIELYKMDLNSFLDEKMKHLKYLEQRKNFYHEHFLY